MDYGIKIDLDKLQNILSKEESYTLNKPAKTKFTMRKVLVYYVYEQLQAELFYTDTKQTGPENQNDNYKYLLTVIDVLSKYAWVIPLKDKTGKSITEAFELILSTIKSKLLQVDKGTEFYNTNFEADLEKINNKMFSSNSDKKNTNNREI